MRHARLEKRLEHYPHPPSPGSRALTINVQTVSQVGNYEYIYRPRFQVSAPTFLIAISAGDGHLTSSNSATAPKPSPSDLIHKKLVFAISCKSQRTLPLLHIAIMYCGEIWHSYHHNSSINQSFSQSHTRTGESTSQHHHRGQQTLHHEVVQAWAALVCATCSFSTPLFGGGS